jgi:nitrogen fixation NifU-like protein
MNELQELYQEVILDHNKSPRNYGELENASNFAEGFNPLCGDHFNIQMKMDGNLIREIKFHGSGCAISKSSASIMTTILKGKTKSEAHLLFNQFHELVTKDSVDEEALIDLGKLAVFAGVKAFPTRTKCASLPWHTMKAALEDQSQPVTTE